MKPVGVRMNRIREIMLEELRKKTALGQSVTIRRFMELTGRKSTGTIHSNLVALEEMELAERDHTGKWFATDGFVTPADAAVAIIDEAIFRLDPFDDPMIEGVVKSLSEAIKVLKGGGNVPHQD